MPIDAAANASAVEGDLTAEERAWQRKMKGVVIGLGLLILLAFAGVVFGMVYRAGRIGKNPAPAAASVALPAAPVMSPAAALLPDVKLGLPRGSEVRSSSLQGNRLLVHHESPAGGGFTIVDLTTGAVVSRVTIERER